MNTETLHGILTLARWAPSGDNTQPHRFEVLNDHQVVIHGFDTRDWCVYDLDGRASQMAIGALLETFCLAATRFGVRAQLSRLDSGEDETHLRFLATLHDAPGQASNPLAEAIETRCVQRRPLATTTISDQCRNQLESALQSGYGVRWFSTFADRWSMAWLMFANAKIRLTCREAYEVHRSIIDWGERYSTTRIPEQAVGVDPMTAKLMRWVMADWRRVQFFNRYLLGTLAPRLQLDLIPGLFCGAHFAIVAPAPVRDVNDALAAGAAMQRFWLAVTQCGLQLQPEMTPLIFARYVREGIRFSASEAIINDATLLSRRFEAIFAGIDPARIAFLGRCGYGQRATSRSLRLELEELTWRRERPRWQ